MNVFDPEQTRNSINVHITDPRKLPAGQPYQFTLAFTIDGETHAIEGLSMRDMQTIRTTLLQAQNEARKWKRETEHEAAAN